MCRRLGSPLFREWEGVPAGQFSQNPRSFADLHSDEQQCVAHLHSPLKNLYKIRSVLAICTQRSNIVSSICTSLLEKLGVLPVG